MYHASVYVSNFSRAEVAYSRLTPREREMYDGHEFILESYHYVHNERYVGRMRQDGRRIFLDSGAFSAWMQGVTIDMGRFCDYVQQNADIIEVASVLDVIGDPDGTYRNQCEMERRGVRALPCYHYGEPEEVLQHYVANYEYVTIGGMVPVSESQLRVWLDRVWERHLVHADGSPKVRVHGFGLTKLRLVARYPWFSVDSSSWQAYGSNGRIYMPNGGWGSVVISPDHSAAKVAGQHVDNLPAPQREAVEDVVRQHGCDPDLMREHYSHRWAWNMWSLPRGLERLGLCERFTATEHVLF